MSSWKFFSSTHPLIFFLLPLGRHSVLAFFFHPKTHLFSGWSSLPLSFRTSFSHHDSIPSHDLVIWTYGSVSFPFGEGNSDVLAYYPLWGAKATLAFWLAQYIQAFPLKPAPFCELLAGFSSTIMTATSISCSSSQILALSFFLSSISHSLAYLAQTIFSFLLYYQAILGSSHSFLPGKNTADELNRQDAQLHPPTVPCSLSPFVSHIHCSLFSVWGRAVSSKFFGT